MQNSGHGKVLQGAAFHIWTKDGSFDETKKITNKPVLLVDDVCTTGSTLKACIRLLKQHGVKKIQVLVMSKVIQRGKGDGL